MAIRLTDHFVGALVGMMTGDALGRSTKNHTPDELRDHEELGRAMIGGFYSEDTEMMITVAESLLACDGVDRDDLAVRFGENLTPMRGYNPGALEVMYRLQRGIDWRDANRAVFPDGSYGIGGAPRAAPVGLMYHGDHDALVAAAAASAEVTHTHPVGMAGAVTVALGVSLALEQGSPDDLLIRLLDALTAWGFGAFLPHLGLVRRLLDADADTVRVVEWLGGNTLTVQQCVPASVYSVLRFWDSFEDAVSFAAQVGGDADSIAAMAGALAGARHGVRTIPGRWLERLENEERGYSTVVKLAKRLYDRWQAATGD